MLFGRFVPILAVLALAGSLAAQKRVEPGAGTLPTHGPLFGVLVWRHRRPGRRPHLLPGAGPRARSRRHSHDAPPIPPLDRSIVDRQQLHAERTGRAVGAGRVLTRASCWRSLPDALRKLDPRTQLRNPVMFVVWVGSVVVTALAVADPSVFSWLIAIWLWFTVAVRQPRRGRRRGPRQGPGRRACAGPAPTPSPAGSVGDGTRGGGPRHRPEGRRPGRRRGRAR